MKYISQSLLISAAMLCSMSASAASPASADNTYLGVGYHLGSYDETGVPTASPNAIKLEVGKYVAPNVAIEGHLLFGSGSDTITYLGIDIDLKLKNAISVFVKGDLPLSDAANLYGLLGFTKGKIEASAPAQGVYVSEDDNGLSYGFGAEVAVGSDMYISGEYIMYISESEYDYTGFNIGISKKF